jgi:hypothetical protein
MFIRAFQADPVRMDFPEAGIQVSESKYPSIEYPSTQVSSISIEYQYPSIEYRYSKYRYSKYRISKYRVAAAVGQSIEITLWPNSQTIT